jgi:hypothetical protein
MKTEEELDVPSFLRRPLFSHRRQTASTTEKAFNHQVRT